MKKNILNIAIGILVIYCSKFIIRTICSLLLSTPLFFIQLNFEYPTIFDATESLKGIITYAVYLNYEIVKFPGILVISQNIKWKTIVEFQCEVITGPPCVLKETK